MNININRGLLFFVALIIYTWIAINVSNSYYPEKNLVNIKNSGRVVDSMGNYDYEKIETITQGIVENKLKIKNFNIDYAGIILGGVSILLTVLLIFTFRDLEKIEGFKKNFESYDKKFQEYDKKFTGYQAQFDENKTYINDSIKNVDSIIKTLESNNIDFIEHNLEKLTMHLFNTEIIDRNYYNEYNLMLAEYRIKTKNRDSILRGIMYLRINGKESHLLSLKKIYTEPKFDQELKDEAQITYDKILIRCNPQKK